MDILTGWISQKHNQVTFHSMSICMFSGDSIYIVISERKNLAYSFLVKIVIMHILWINITWACSCQVLWDSMYCQREEYCCLHMLKCQGLLSSSHICIQNTEVLLSGPQILAFQHLLAELAFREIIHKGLILVNHWDRFNLDDNQLVCFHVHRHAKIQKMCDWSTPITKSIGLFLKDIFFIYKSSTSRFSSSEWTVLLDETNTAVNLIWIFCYVSCLHAWA